MLGATNVDSTPIQSTQFKTQKRTTNYMQDEDIQLRISLENVSSDPIVGSELPGKAYRSRITQNFHANQSFEYNRNACSFEHRWGTIQREYMKFQAMYEDVECRHPSGVPYQEHMSLCWFSQFNYMSCMCAYLFTHWFYNECSCWKHDSPTHVERRNHFLCLIAGSRWGTHKNSNQLIQGRRRRLTTPKKQNTSNATLSDWSNINEAGAQEDIGSPQTPGSSQMTQGQRHIGRKHTKGQLKNKGEDDGSYKNVI